MKANIENDKFFLGLVDSGKLKVDPDGTITNLVTGNILGNISPKGYVSIAWKVDGKTKHLLAHRLVYLVYKGSLSELDQINHIDGIKTHNFIDNLEKTDNKGNRIHAVNMGLIDQTKINESLKKFYSTRRSASAKYDEKTVQEIRDLYKTGNYSERELAIRFNMPRSTLHWIVVGKNYRNSIFV